MLLPSGVQELLPTLAVGLIAVTLLSAVVWLLFAARNFRKAGEQGFFEWFTLLQWTPANESQVVRATFLFFVVYMTGMVVESVSGRYSDTGLGWLDEAVLLPSEIHLRVKTLIKDHKLREDRLVEGTPSSLGRDLAQAVGAKPGYTATLDELGALFGCLTKSVEGAANKQTDCNSARDGAGGAINSVYYLAKNWCYSQRNYFEELIGIQRRIDFFRSATIVAELVFLFAVLIGLSGSLALLKRTTRSWAREHLERCGAVVVVSAVLGILGYWAFSATELEFNRRVFGYFSTELEWGVDERGKPPNLDDWATVENQEGTPR